MAASFIKKSDGNFYMRLDGNTTQVKFAAVSESGNTYTFSVAGTQRVSKPNNDFGAAYSTSSALPFPLGAILDNSRFPGAEIIVTYSRTIPGINDYLLSFTSAGPGTVFYLGGESLTWGGYAYPGDGYLTNDFNFGVKDGGSWKNVGSTFIKDNGVWKECEGIWIKQGGLWKQFFANYGNSSWICMLESDDDAIDFCVQVQVIEGIIDDGLVLNLDAGDLNSYPGFGNTWFDLTGNNNDGTLSGVNYNNGYMSFDGTGDYIQVDPINRSNTTTIEVWFRVFNSENFFSSRNPIPSGWFAVSRPGTNWSDFMNKYAVYISDNQVLDGIYHTTNWDITVLKPGNYTLKLQADNTSTLSIDGVEVASSVNIFNVGDIPIQESIFLNEGYHQISCVVYNIPSGTSDWNNNPAGIAWTLEYESDPTPLSTDLTVRQYLYTQQQDPPTLANFTYKERQGVHIAGNVIHFQYLNTNNDVVTSVSSNIISPNVWYNLTVTLDGTTPLMYLNGSLIPSEIWSSSSSNLVSKAVDVNEGFIGRRGDAQGNDYLRGNIAIVRDYNRALTPAEVQQNFNAVKDRFIPSSIVTNGLVLNLDAGDVNSYSGSGDTWFDLSGNGNNGTLVNMDGSNYSGGALSFDGSDEYVQIIGNASNTPSSMTLFCFIYPTNTRPEEIIAAQDNGLGYRFMTRVYENETGTLWGFKPTGDVNIVPPPPELVEYKGTTALRNNTWYCLAITYTTSNLVLYLNGNAELNQSNPYALTHGGNIRLGDGIGSAQRHLQGNLPIFMMYNRALTAAEIQQNFLALKDRFPSSIVTNGLVLNLDADDVNSYSGSGDTWFDLSGNGNNGTLVNMDGSNYSDGALSFDGSDEYVDLSSSTYNYTTQNSCLVAFRPSDVFSYFGEVLQKGQRFDFRIRFVNETGQFQLYYALSSGDEIFYTTTEILSNDQWYIAQMTIDCSTNLVARFYLNGVKRGENSINPGLSLRNTTSELRSGNISQSGGIEYYNGRIAVIQMYERFLDENEIQQNFLALRGRFGI